MSVEKIEQKISGNPTIPSVFVDHVIDLPKGASPCSCLNYYDIDSKIIDDYINLEFEDYFRKYIR